MGQRQRRTGEKEIINILEKHARTQVKVSELLSQSLAKDMGAAPETLRENSPCKLSGGLGVRVLPGEGKEKV